jgi:outer membrane protein TolC
MGILAAETLSLDQAEDLAVANSRTLETYFLTERNNALTEQSNLYAQLPSLGSASVQVGGTFWAENWDAVDKTTDKPTYNSLGDYIVGSLAAKLSLPSSVSMSIWDGGKYSIQKQLSAITSETTRNQALQAYYQVLSDVDQAYFNVLLAQENLENAEAAYRGALLTLNIAEVRFESGIIARDEYLQAQASKESSENTRNQTRRSLFQARTTLQNLTGLKELPELDPVSFDKYEALITGLASLDDSAIDRLYASLLAAVRANNPQFLNSGLSLDSAKLAVDQAKTGYMPSFRASLNFPSPTFTLSSDPAITWSNFGLTITGSISLDFWVTANSVAKSENALGRQWLSYQDAEENLAVNVYTTILQLISQASSVLSAERSLEISQQQYEYAEALFNLAQYSMSNFSTASESLIRSQYSLNQSRYTFLNSLSNLRGLGAFADMQTLMDFLLPV